MTLTELKAKMTKNVPLREVKFEDGHIIKEYIISENELFTLVSQIAKATFEAVRGEKKEIDEKEHERRRFNEECICDICDDISRNQAISDMEKRWESFNN